MPEAGGAAERLAWVQQFAQTRDAASVCRQFAICRATLRKWWLRYEANGLAGLEEASHGRRLIARCLRPKLR
jgi:transposase-like protein